MARQIRVIIQVKDEAIQNPGWRNAWRSDELTDQATTAEVIAVLDGAVTKLEVMTGRL